MKSLKILLFLLGLTALAGCTDDLAGSTNSGLAQNKKDVQCNQDEGGNSCGARDIRQDNPRHCPPKIGVTSNNPNAWKDNQVCLEWKEVPYIMGCTANQNPNQCSCWKPPYCWCVDWEGTVTAACDPEDKLCCNFTSDCIPCGWHQMTQEEWKARNWDYSFRSPECDKLNRKTLGGDYPEEEHRACSKWK